MTSARDIIKAIGLSAWVATVLDVAVSLIPRAAADAPLLPVLAAGRGVFGDTPTTAGAGEALLGVGVHLALMLAAAAVFVAAARLISPVARRAISFGVLYGVALYFVLPHAGERAVDAADIALGILRHVLCIGLPFGLITVQLIRPPGAGPSE